MNEQAQRHLLRLLDKARAGPPDPLPHQEWRRESLSRFGATLEALRAVEAITQDEHFDWHNRLLVTLGIEPTEPFPPGVHGARMILIGDPEAEPVVPRPSARFLRVV